MLRKKKSVGFDLFLNVAQSLNQDSNCVKWTSFQEIQIAHNQGKRDLPKFPGLSAVFFTLLVDGDNIGYFTRQRHLTSIEGADERREVANSTAHPSARAVKESGPWDLCEFSFIRR